MKKGRIKLVCIFVGALVTTLAVLGLTFCWACSARLHDVGGVCAHWHFRHQLGWNILGIIGFGVALIVGWKRWLKVAPFIFAGWVVLFLVAHMQPMINGGHSFAMLGPIRLEVWCLFPIAIALMVSWLSDRYGIRAKRILLLALFSVCVTIALKILTNPNRISHMVMFFNGEAASCRDVAAANVYAQHQCLEVFAASKWFSQGDLEVLQTLPGVFTHAMPAASSVVFGKWFLAVVLIVYGVLAGSLVCCYRSVGEYAKRMFIVIAGLGILVPAALGCCECMGLVPMLRTCVPLVSYGGTAVFATWFCVGIIVSACNKYDL